MTTTKEKADCSPWQGESAQQTTQKPKNSTQMDRVIAELHQPHGLNRFESERIGCHVLNSTVAVIRKRYGSKLVSEWETVPTRFCERGVRVCRYWIKEVA